MIGKLAYFVSMVAFFSLVFAGENLSPEKIELYTKIVGALCQPLPADKAAIVTECEKLVPLPVHDVFHACIRQALSITTIDKPIFCYKAGPGREKIDACLLERQKEAAEHGIVIDQKMYEEYRDKYMGCMAKAM